MFLKGKSKRFMSVFLTFILMVNWFMPFPSVSANSEAVNIAVFGPQTVKAPVMQATGGMLQDSATLTHSSNPDGIVLNNDNVPAVEGWQAGADTKYWLIELSTEGYENLTISSEQRGSNTGPRDFKIQSSLDGETWTDVSGTNITVANDNYVTGVVKDRQLSASLDNQNKVYLRWIMTSNNAINGSLVGATGVNRLANVVIKGERIMHVTPDTDVVVFGVQPRENAALFNATDGVLKDSGTLKSSHATTHNVNADMYPSTNGWQDGANEKYWVAEFSTQSYGHLTLSSGQMSSATGPRDFRVQSSLDGVVWTDVPGTTVVTGSNDNYASGAIRDIPLPSSLSDQSKVYLRWIMSSNTSVNGGTVASTGTSRIADITIKGARIIPTDEVVADVASGSSVPRNAVVTLSVAATDAVIEYQLNGNSPVQSTSNEVPVTVDAFNQAGNTAVIKARAIVDGAPADEFTFTYTQAKLESVSANRASGSALRDGALIRLMSFEDVGEIRYTLTEKAGTGDEVVNSEATYSEAITLTADMFPVRITTYKQHEDYLSSDVTTFDYTLDTTNPDELNHYYGQLHSHTNDSDGTGTIEEAYDHAKNTAQLDFFSVTDHSNNLDTSNSSSAVNTTAPKFVNGMAVAAAATDEDFIGLYGWEMTWSGGPGHINTWNLTDPVTGDLGFVSRNSTWYNSKTNDIGLQRYYDLLVSSPGSISQLNHPGTTFGTFGDFGYYTPARDAMIQLIEVGNGEGNFPSGYWRSHDEYTRALDKGWHLAPTANQDNHRGRWGNSNGARTVALAESLSLENIYDAFRNLRVYATENENLRISYTLNDEVMGTILDTTPDTVDIRAVIEDPDEADLIKKVSLIVDGGKEIGVQHFDSNTVEYTFTEPAEYAYYYLKVEQVGGEIAVTAPIWTKAVEKAGIDSVAYDVVVPVKDEAINFTTKLFNNENQNLVVGSITYKVNGEVVGTDNSGFTVTSNSTRDVTFAYTPTVAGPHELEVIVEARISGQERTYTSTVGFHVKDGSNMKTIGIIATHQNEYVTGRYAGSMSNFTQLAGENDVRIVEVRGSITPEQLATLDGLIVTPPTRLSSGTAPDGSPFVLKTYAPEEIQAIKDWAEDPDKLIIVTGLGDRGETSSMPAQYHAAAQQNSILTALGANTLLVDDLVCDDDSKVNENFRLMFNTYNFDNEFTARVVPEQLYSFYSGSHIEVLDGTKVSTIVSTHPTTYSHDFDGDGNGGEGNPIVKGSNPALTVETLDSGATLFVGGTVFMSNFEIRVDADNIWTLPYSNYTITENILRYLSPEEITPIAEVKEGTSGEMFTIIGRATSNSSDFDKDTGFFGSIYVQDETGGINLHPIEESIQEGQEIKVTGTLSSYQGEIQLDVSNVVVTDPEVKKVEPTEVTPAASMLPENTGKLLKIQGVVSDIVFEQGIIESFRVNGVTRSGSAYVFMDGYITPGYDQSDIVEGAMVEVIGLGSIDDTKEGPRIRIRDRADIKLASKTSQAAPVLSVVSADNTSVTLSEIAGAEYMLVDKDGNPVGAWQDSNVFTGLNPDTEYSFVARMKETTTANASGVSNIVTIKTLLAPTAPEKADKEKLQKLYDEVESNSYSEYTKESVAALEKAMENAKKILDNPDATQEEIDAAYDALRKALNDLVEVSKPNPEIPNKGKLQDLYNKNVDRDLSGYTEESAAAFKAAMKDAQAVLSNPDATQKEIDDAYAALQKAIDNLEKVTPPGPGSKPEPKPKPGQKPDSDNPNTSDSGLSSVKMLFIAILLTATLVVTTRKRKFE